MKRCKFFLLSYVGIFVFGLLPASGFAQTNETILQDEAGHMPIEPISFFLHMGGYFSRLTLQSSETRIWYSFQVADQDSANKPLLVFFNGGPSSSTSSGLMSMYTSRYTLDNSIEDGGGDVFLPNPYSWTHLGNLMYIDARQSGFSYSLMSGVYDFGARFREFNAQNFNSFLDAADFIRLILRFLASHPEIQGNRVVIVGESYGGVRSLTMLHLLLNYRDYSNGVEMYQDEALVNEIQAHYDVVFPEYLGQEVPPEIIARQFGHQILIQPALTYGYQLEVGNEMLVQEGGVIDKLELETGIPYNPSQHGDPFDYVLDVAERDIYIYTKPRGWLTGFFLNAGRLLRFADKLIQMTGVDVTGIDSLYASQRGNAYRVYNPESSYLQVEVAENTVEDLLFKAAARLEASQFTQEPGNMETVFGSLQPWDRYFLGTNYTANSAFHFWNVALMRGYDIHLQESRYGRMFLKNVAHVETFITNAAYDLIVYAPAIPGAFERHTDILISAEHQKSLPDQEARPGRIALHYREGAFPDIPDLSIRTIRFPIYDKSCHAVSLTQPEEFFLDIQRWLIQHGVIEEE